MTKSEYIQTIKDELLFRGIDSQEVTQPLKPNSFENILWTALTPDVAQNYIPEAGIKAHISFDMAFETSLNEAFRPDKGFNQALYEMLGYDLGSMQIKYDQRGRATSFASVDKNGKQRLTKREAAHALTEIGYPYSRETPAHWIKTTYIDRKETILPADHKNIGTLVLIHPRANLNIYDITDLGGDLTNPQYHKRDLFFNLQESGYDGVKINDYAQSQINGNFGHVSVGLFPSGIQQCSCVTIPATNFDWDSWESVQAKTTPEFTAWAESEYEKLQKCRTKAPTTTESQMERP
jgi:hypothetical protein